MQYGRQRERGHREISRRDVESHGEGRGDRNRAPAARRDEGAEPDARRRAGRAREAGRGRQRVRVLARACSTGGRAVRRHAADCCRAGAGIGRPGREVVGPERRRHRRRADHRGPARRCRAPHRRARRRAAAGRHLARELPRALEARIDELTLGPVGARAPLFVTVGRYCKPRRHASLEKAQRRGSALVRSEKESECARA
nr:hypothetical protein 4.2 [Burkholderia phage Bups phi1]